ncbi:hypothetical protein ACYJ1Y_11500 [Natrialbaceae archaeon A-gly3]
MTSHIKLYGDKGDRFEEIKADLTRELGYEPSNPEVVGLLMAAVDVDELLGTATASSTRRTTVR